MRLFVRALLLFLAVIVLQAALAHILVTRSIVSANERDISEDLEQESHFVGAGFKQAKRGLWTSLVRISHHQGLKQSLNNDAGSPLIREQLDEILVNEAVHWMQINLRGHGVKRIGLSMLPPSSFDYPAVERPHPVVNLQQTDTGLYLVGRLPLKLAAGTGEIHAVRYLGSEFFTGLTSLPESEVLLLQGEEIRGFSSHRARNIAKASDTLGKGASSLEVEGSQWHVGSTYLPDGWRLVVLRSNTLHEQRLQRIVNSLIWVSLVSALIAIVVGFIFSRHISAPVGRLLAALREIRAGNLETNAASEGIAEFDEVADDFNAMTAALRGNHDEMLRYLNEITKLKDYNETIIDSIGVGILIVGPEAKLADANRSIYENHHLDPDHSKGLELRKLLPDIFSEKLMLTLEDVRQGERESYSVRLRLESGQVFDIGIYPVNHQDKETDAQAVVVLDNITEQEQMAVRLHQSEKMDAVGQLAGGIAHDFNNMLSGIMGAAELLKGTLPDTPKAKKYHKLIMESSAHAADLTRNLLTFSRREAEDVTVVDIHDVIADTAALLHNTIDRRVTITQEPQAKGCRIRGSGSQLQSALLNLGINASHAMPDGGTLTLSTQSLVLGEEDCKSSAFELKPGAFIEVRICDTGTGIEPEHLEKIFDPFFTTKRSGKGTGLGLSAVAATVRSHGGSVSVESRLGEGTCFTLLLPLTDMGGKTSPDTKRIVKGKGTVLVVDDESVIRICATSMLEELGYKTLEASNGKEALELYRNKSDHINLVLLDMVMPVMNGRDCFLGLKDINPEVMVVVATGYAAVEDMDRLRAEGLSGMLRKPYRQAALSQIVHEVLKA